ncbi:MAG: GDP-mannose 4,6-dehydratase [Candidatus Hydrogenedentes bacterium]|nr:GDP-mannose 4,6-dehydratase [Candidatus Hydrogenedentota bacterium]
MKNAALITGVNGFVGQVLSRYLRERGWNVLGAVQPPAAKTASSFPCDLTNRAEVEELAQWAKDVTHVFHLAAVTYIPQSQSDPALAMNVNLNGTIHLLHAVRACAPDARFLYVSSAAVYGVPKSLPITEEHPLNPNEPYGISKAAADAFCDYLHRNSGMDVIRVRPFNHSGPGQADHFVLSSLARQIALIERGAQEPVLHVGNLDVARDFLHVDDVVRAYESLMEKGEAGQVYNVCSGVSHSLRSILDTLREHAAVPIRLETDPERVRRVDIPNVCGSRARITRHTEWEPRIPFAQLLEDLLNYWRTREAGV